MKLRTAGLIVCAGTLVGLDAAATRVCIPPRPQPEEPRPRILPVTQETPGVRIAGYGTSRLRTFRLRAHGYLCCVVREKGKGSTRSRVPVTFVNRPVDWEENIRIVVKRISSFRIIIDSGHPTSFDSFEFEDVGPGTYVFTLDSLDSWRGPVDVALRYRGRIIRTRTVHSEVMAHPPREYTQPWKRAPRGALQTEQFAEFEKPDD